jgi:hypothetical protein
VILGEVARAEAGHAEVVVAAFVAADAHGVCDVVAALVADELDAATGSTRGGRAFRLHDETHGCWWRVLKAMRLSRAGASRAVGK